jgi:hypothetical protein
VRPNRDQRVVPRSCGWCTTVRVTGPCPVCYPGFYYLLQEVLKPPTSLVDLNRRTGA